MHVHPHGADGGAGAAASLDRLDAGIRDLARLRWFAWRDERLVLRDPEAIGPVVDTHTHVALTYLRRPDVDLHATHPRTELLLPAERPVDMRAYLNRSFTPADLAAVRRDLSFHGIVGGGRMRSTHTLANLARDGADLGIRSAVLLAIDLPLISRNAETWLAAAGRDPRFVVFGSVHPYTPFLRRRLDRQVRLGARGIKVHPVIQLVAPDDARAMRLYALCGERRLPVFFHCGPTGIGPRAGERLARLDRYRRAVEAHPQTVFVLGHTGALEGEAGIELARAFPNVWVETSSQSTPMVERIVRDVPIDRIVFGTDWPFYHQAIGLAKVLLATEGDERARRAILHDNALRLVSLAA